MNVLHFSVQLFLYVLTVMSCDQFILLSNLLTKRLEPHTLTFLLASKIYDKKVQNLFFSKTPSIIINIEGTKTTNDNRSLTMPILQNPRNSTIFIIYVDANEFEKSVWNILDDLVNISPIPTRPKCLLILTENGDLSVKNIQKALDYAWFLKFLDFTVLKIDDSNKIVYSNFNPFTQVYEIKCLNLESEIFPDKLLDVKNYPLTIPVYSNEPYMQIKGEGENLKVHGTNMDYIQVISQKMNFNNHYIQHPSNASTLLRLRSQLEKNEINLIPITFFISSFNYRRNIVFGRFVETKNLAVVVPIKRVSRFYFSFKIFLCFLSFPVYILIFRSYAKIFKLDPQRWNNLYLYRILTSIPASPPRDGGGRQIFLLIALLSIIHSNLFFSEFEKMKVFYVEKKFDTVDEILKSKMKIYSVHKSEENDLESIQKLYSKRVKLNRSEECLQKLIQTRFAVCILTEKKAKYFAELNLSEDLKPIVKTSMFIRDTQLTPFPYEKASPYAEKFDKILLQIVECGITKISKVKYEIKTHKFKGNSKKEDIDILARELLVIVTVGVFSAMLVFIGELVDMKLVLRILVELGKFIVNLLF